MKLSKLIVLIALTLSTTAHAEWYWNIQKNEGKWIIANPHNVVDLTQTSDGFNVKLDGTLATNPTSLCSARESASMKDFLVKTTVSCESQAFTVHLSRGNQAISPDDVDDGSFINVSIGYDANPNQSQQRSESETKKQIVPMYNRSEGRHN